MFMVKSSFWLYYTFMEEIEFHIFIFHVILLYSFVLMLEELMWKKIFCFCKYQAFSIFVDTASFGGGGLGGVNIGKETC